MSQPYNQQGIPTGKTIQGDGFSDIRKMFRHVVANWYLFVIFVPLALGGVWVYHRYTVPVYKASITMIFKVDQERSLSQQVLTEGFGLSPELRNFENQSFIIRSHAMVLRAVNRLDFGVAYYSKGRFKDTELYGRTPFVVEFDSLHPQLLNTDFELSVLPGGKTELSVKTEGGRLHVFHGAQDAGYSGPIDFSAEARLGQRIEHPCFSFVIKAAESNGGIASGNYYFRFKSHSEIASELRSSLSVSPYREGSSIIFISATGVQPQKLIRFLNTFSEELIENNLERKNDMANRSLTFIQRQLEQVAETLKITQQKLMDFRRDNRYMMPSDVSSKLSDEFFGMEKQKRSLELSLAYFDEIRRRLVSGNLEESDFLLPAFSTEPAALIQQFVREHLTLLNEARVIAQQAGENNPYLVELNQKIELSGQSLILSIDQQMESIRMQMRELKQTEAQLNAEIGNLPELERDYLAMERTHKLNDAIYTFLLQKSSETQIAKASNTPDNEVLDPAYINGVVSPSKKSNYTRGLLLGFAIPVLIIGLRELFNTRIRSRDDVRSMFRELPIIGEILRSKEGSDNVVLKAATSEVTESFRSLRARLKYMMAGKDGCIITVSSTNTGDGKTFCAVNLASVLAISGKKTVLVGFDLRKPRLSEIFGLKNISGLSSYLIAQSELDEITFETDVKNLYIIPGGHIPPNPSELISSPSTQTLFETLRTKYDVIIVDTPPVGLVSDGRLLMEMADCNLYIVRAGVTDKEHFAVTMSNLFDDKIIGLAVVMNDVQIAGRNYGYYSSGY